MNSNDYTLARRNPHTLLDPAPINDAYDINRDKKVDGSDLQLIRNSYNNFRTDLELIEAPLSVVNDLNVEVYSHSSAWVVWNDNSKAESGYRLTGRDAAGNVLWTELAPKNATGHLLENLAAGSTFRLTVEAVDAQQETPGPAVTDPSATFTTQERLTSGNDRQFVISLASEGYRGEAGFLLVGDDIEQAAPQAGVTTLGGGRLLVTAPDIQTAVRKAITGSATIEAANWQLAQPIWGQRRTYNFATSGAFIVEADGKRVGIEDLTGWAQYNDYDYDDFLWDIRIAEVGNNAVDPSVLIPGGVAPEDQHYTLTLLSDYSGRAHSINNQGIIAGTDFEHAARWYPGASIQVLNMPSNTTSSVATVSTDNAGLTPYDNDGDSGGENIVGTLTRNGQTYGFIWGYGRGGVPTEAGTQVVGPPGSKANDDGAGSAYGVPATLSPNNGFTYLSTYPGYITSAGPDSTHRAYTGQGNGEIPTGGLTPGTIGTFGVFGGGNGAIFADRSDRRGWAGIVNRGGIWRPYRDIGGPGSINESVPESLDLGIWGSAYGINEFREVVGSYSTGTSTNQFDASGFLIERDGQYEPLPTSGGPYSGFVWIGSQHWDLNDIVSRPIGIPTLGVEQPDGFRIESAQDINQQGQVVGWGRDASGNYRGFVLNPGSSHLPEFDPPSQYVDFAVVLAGDQRAIEIDVTDGLNGITAQAVELSDGQSTYQAVKNTTTGFWEVEYAFPSASGSEVKFQVKTQMADPTRVGYPATTHWSETRTVRVVTQDELDNGTDTDDDGVSDAFEWLNGTDFNSYDTDGDLLADGWEFTYWDGQAGPFNPLIFDDATLDSDGDGLNDLGEAIHGSDPTVGDTDDDGVSDNQEATNGSDPLDPSDEGKPPADDQKAKFRLTVGDPSGSHSERWILKVGDLNHQSPGFGEVGSGDYWYKVGKSYSITVKHAGSNLDEPDYDYTATVSKIEGSATHWIQDENGLLGNFGGGSTNPAKGKTATLHLPQLDADIDSDNNNGFGAPARSDDEDRIEQDSSTGKYLTLNTGDLDQDNVPDYADLNISGGQFVPVVISLSENVSEADPSQINLSFSYSGSDPSGLTPVNGIYPAAQAGAMRIWKKNANSRSLGDYIAPGTPVNADDLGLSPGGSVTLYVEGISSANASGPISINVTADVTGNKWSGSLADKVHVIAAGVDIDIDSDDNNGLGNPSRSEVEESIEDTQANPELPGKILLVNDADTDLDGLPDFADGYGLDDSDVAASVGFTPIIVEIPQLSDFESGQIQFVYDDSDPAGVIVNQTQPWLTQAASGSLRLWTKSGELVRNSASINSGGDYIASGTSIDLASLPAANQIAPGQYRFYLESVRPSVEVADHSVEIIVTPTGGGEPSRDRIRATSVGYQFVQFNGGQTATPTKGFAPSTSTPIVAINSASITNVRASSDKTRILGDLTVSGTVDSDLADLIPGSDGTISTAELYLNNRDASVGSITINVSKSTQANDWLQPYPYTGTFSQTFSGIELSDGVNVVRIDAKEPTTEAVVSAEASFEVEVTQPTLPSSVSLTNYAVTMDLNGVSATPSPSNVITVSATYGGTTVLASLTQNTTDPTRFTDGLNTVDFFNQADIARVLDTTRQGRVDVGLSIPTLIPGTLYLPLRETTLTSKVLQTHLVAASVDLLGGLDGSSANTISAQVQVFNGIGSGQTYTWSLTETGASTNTFQTADGLNQLTLGASSGGSFTSATTNGGTTGYEYLPIEDQGNGEYQTNASLLESEPQPRGDYSGATFNGPTVVTGPTADAGSLNAYGIQIQGPQDYLAYLANGPGVEVQGQTMTLQEIAGVTGAYMVSHPDTPAVPLTIVGNWQPDPNSEVNLDELLGAHPEDETGLDAFLIGFAQGVGIGLKENTVGVVQGLDSARKAIGEYLGYAWAVKIGGADPSLVERPKLLIFTDQASELAQLAWDLYKAGAQAQNELTKNLILGNWDAVGTQLSATGQQTYTLAAETISWVIESLANQSDHAAGKILGQAIFEIASTFIPGGQVAKLTKLQALTNLQNAKFITQLNLGPRLSTLITTIRNASTAGLTGIGAQKLVAFTVRSAEEVNDVGGACRRLEIFDDLLDPASLRNTDFGQEDVWAFTRYWTRKHLEDAQATGRDAFTVAQLQGRIPEGWNVAAHHIVPTSVLKNIFNLPDSAVNNVPGLLLDKNLHSIGLDNRPNSFHALLHHEFKFPLTQTKLREWSDSFGNDTAARDDALKSILGNTYREWATRNTIDVETRNAIIAEMQAAIDALGGVEP